MPRPIKATIHMGSLRHNLAAMKKLANGRTLWAVVKANAYGHGLERAVRAFTEADGLAMIDIVDIQRARSYGWTKRILLLQGFFRKDDLPIIERLGAETVVHNEEGIRLLEEAAPFHDLKVHIKINIFFPGIKIGAIFIQFVNKFSRGFARTGQISFKS